MPGVIISFFLILLSAIIRKRWLMHFLLMGMSYMFAMGPSSIPDRESYIEIYNEPFALNHIGNFEYGYLLLCYVCNFVFDIEFEIFLFVIFFVSFEIWLFVSKKIFDNNNLYIALALFMSFFGYFYFGIVIRNMMALILIYIAFYTYLYCKGGWKYILFLFMGFLAYEFHRISGVFIFLTPLLTLKIPQRTYLWIFLLSVGLMLMGSLTFIQMIVEETLQIEGFDRIGHYVDSVDTSTSIVSVQILFNLLLSLFILHQRDKIVDSKKSVYDFFLNLNFVGVFVMAVCWRMPTAYRLYNIFFFYNFVPLYFLFFYSNSRFFSQYKYVASVLLSTIYLIILIYCNPFMLMF